MSDLRERVVLGFERHFNAKPTHIAVSPGRVNLIGEHVDYNGGSVLPMAIDRAVWIAFTPRSDDRVRVASLDFNDELREFDAGNIDLSQRREGGEWIEYVKGVAWALQQRSHTLRGWDGVISGDVPAGAGLSSSAALELAVARTFCASSGFIWEPKSMALTGQAAENQWVGVNCGIMDQLISASGQAGHALLMDCATLTTTPFPLPTGTAVVILDTATRRGLESSAYNDRRAQCEEAAQFFGVKLLKDVSPAEFAKRETQLPEPARRRARHIISEIERTTCAAEAMKKNDAIEFGQLMNASHASLRDDFEVSNAELNVMAEIAQQTPGCFGARMTGAGFGGCAVALVGAGAVDSFAQHVAAEYEKKTGLTPAIYISLPAQGTHLHEV